MQLFLDTANLNEIKEMSDILLIDGVTTNPTLVSREGKKITQLLEEIVQIIGEEKAIHVQVLSRDFESMINEGKFISKLYKNIYVKIPVIEHGFKAIKHLSSEGVKTTATAVFTAHQAVLAAKAGADYIAPYVNRLDNISGEGVKTVGDIVNIIDQYNFKSKVLAASFKNPQQVIDIIKQGVHSATISYEVLKNMIMHPLTDYSVDKFISDWEAVYGSTDLVTHI